MIGLLFVEAKDDNLCLAPLADKGRPLASDGSPGNMVDAASLYNAFIQD